MAATFDIGMLSQSSSSSDLSESKLSKLVCEARPAATDRSTTWGMGKFIAWQAKLRIVVDMADMTAAELNQHLRKFLWGS